MSPNVQIKSTLYEITLFKMSCLIQVVICCFLVIICQIYKQFLREQFLEVILEVGASQ